MPMNTTSSDDGIVRELAHAMFSVRYDLRGLPADPDYKLSHWRDTREDLVVEARKLVRRLDAKGLTLAAKD